MLRKKIFFSAAAFWTAVILFFCLISANELKRISTPNFDKVIHVFFHFVFTALWFLFFKKKWNNISNYRVFTICIVFSFFFGIIVELLQQYFTVTRSGDILDIVANLVGAILAVIAIIVLDKTTGVVNKI